MSVKREQLNELVFPFSLDFPFGICAVKPRTEENFLYFENND